MYLSPLNYIQNEINLTVISNYPDLQQIDLGRKQIGLGWNKLT